MYGILITSTKIGKSVISTTYHPRNEIYLTRIFGGFLNDEWGHAKTRDEANRMHDRFCNWKRGLEAKYGPEYA